MEFGESSFDKSRGGEPLAPVRSLSARGLGVTIALGLILGFTKVAERRWRRSAATVSASLTLRFHVLRISCSCPAGEFVILLKNSRRWIRSRFSQCDSGVFSAFFSRSIFTF